MKVLLLEGIHSVAKEKMESWGWETELLPTALSDDNLIEKLSSFQVLGIRSKTQVTGKVLEASPHLHALGTFCIGTNQVDLKIANRLGIPVFNAPYSNTRSVAELVISEMIALSRQLFDRSMKSHRGEWSKSAHGSKEVRGKTLGIVGYGHIGSQVSVLAESLGLNVLFYDVIKKLPLGNSRCVESLNELLQQADFVTLHVPETPQTKRMIGRDQLKEMKKGAYLINASRGTVVDLEVLKESLMGGRLSGAAIDVYPEEPKSNKEKFQNTLQGVPNVILTPHIGGSTEEAQEAIGREVAESLRRFLHRGSTLGAVNFPQIETPQAPDSLRLLNVHKNVPGVLREINGIVSELGANIRAQSLGTDDQIGYLVMDVEKSDINGLREAISKLQVSVRTRIVCT